MDYKPPETLDEAIAYFEHIGKSWKEMRKFCVSQEALRNNTQTVTWNMRLVEWLKELKDRREKENENNRAGA